MVAKVLVDQSKILEFVEFLERMPGLYHSPEFFVFFKNTQDLLTNIDPIILPGFVLELRKYLSEYKNGEILKKVHDLQDAKLMAIENQEEQIFGGGAYHEGEQITQFTQLFFCTAADKNMQTIFDLDLRYSRAKSVGTEDDFARLKVLDVEKALYPFLLTIQRACYIDMNDDNSNKVTKFLQVLEGITLAKEHESEKLDRTVSAYSFLAFALCICYGLHKEKTIKVKHLKFGFLRALLCQLSYNLSFDKGRKNIADFMVFIDYADECISFK